MSASLQPHGLQHPRLPCPSLSLRVCSNSCPLSQWCLPIISSSVTRFSCPQSFPALESFPMRLFTSGGQNIGALASVLPTNIQGWFPLELTGLISLLSKGISRVFSSTTFKRHICDKMWVTQQSNFQSMVENVYVSCSSIVKEASMWGLHWIWEAKMFSGLSRHWVIFFFSLLAIIFPKYLLSSFLQIPSRTWVIKSVLFPTKYQ